MGDEKYIYITSCADAQKWFPKLRTDEYFSRDGTWKPVTHGCFIDDGVFNVPGHSYRRLNPAYSTPEAKLLFVVRSYGTHNLRRMAEGVDALDRAVETLYRADLSVTNIQPGAQDFLRKLADAVEACK